MIGLIIGVFVGVILGVVIMALMAAEKGGNEEMILFMTDQQVKHDGKMWGIEEMIRNEDSGLEKRVLTNTGKEKLKCNSLSD